MTIDDARVHNRRVAVGPTREVAAAAFGRTGDDLFVTSYEDLEGEVDLAHVTQLDLVASPDAHETVKAACARLHAGDGPPVRIAVDPSSAADCADVLDRAHVEITELEAVDDLVLLRLAPHTEGSSSTGLVLRALETAHSTTHSRLVEPAPPSTASPRAGHRRPQPLLLDMLARADRWRRGRRRWAALGSVAVVVVTLLLIGLLPGSAQVLVSMGIPLLVLLVVLGAAIPTYTTLLLARQVHRQTGQLERIVRRNRTVVQRRADALARRLDKVEQSQSRLPFLEQYVEAVAEHSAASNARLRELLEILDAERATNRPPDS